MGRKIPAKKHRGVKDPLVQQAKRIESLKGKINAPPKDPDEQPVPKSLMRLFAFQDQDRKKTLENKKKHRQSVHVADDNTLNPVYNPITRLRKLPGESGRGFSLRINSAVKALHNPGEDLDYPVDIETEDVKGLRMAEQRERRARKRRKAAKAAPRGDEPETHLTRTQKLALKKQAKQLKACEAKKDRLEVVYEHVSFGEVTHGPPSLQLRGKGPIGAARPGRRELLLSRLLAPGAAERRRLERARGDAVAAYRALKANNIKNK